MKGLPRRAPTFELRFERDLQQCGMDPSVLDRGRQQRERFAHDNVLAGQLRELGMFSVLKVLGENTSTGNLIVQAKTQTATIFVERGQLVYVALGRHRGPKALYRVVGFSDGRFEFYNPGRLPPERNLAGSIERHLLEAARQIDETEVVRGQLPDGATLLKFNPNMIAPVAKIPFPILEVMAAVHKHETVGAILDGCSLPDLEVCHILVNLLKNKVVLATPA